MSEGAGGGQPPEKSAAEIIAAAQDLGPADRKASEVLDDAEGLAPLEKREQVAAEADTVDLLLQKIVGYGALTLMLVQVIVANVVFLKYAHNVGWGKLPTGAIQAWLAATVVEVIGVVLVIARSVFPEGGRKK